MSWRAICAIIATICWGFDNNLTRVLSSRNPVEVTIIKGLGVSLGDVILSLLMKEIWQLKPSVIIGALLLGFLAYGVSIVFYILAQRGIGAAKTSDYYSVAPFLSVLLAAVFLGEKMTGLFLVALLLMILGSCLVTKDALKANI